MRIKCKKARSHSGSRKIFLLEFESRPECEEFFSLMTRSAEYLDDSDDLINVSDLIKRLQLKLTDRYAHDDVALSTMLTPEEMAFMQEFLIKVMSGLDGCRCDYDHLLSITDDVFECADDAIDLAADCLEERVVWCIKYLLYRQVHEGREHDPDINGILDDMQRYLTDIREFRCELAEEKDHEL